MGRKRLIYPGMIVQAALDLDNIILRWFIFWTICSDVAFGCWERLLHTAAFLLAISDIANPQWRATSSGVYRFWRDWNFVFGAVGIGFIADAFDLNIAIQTVAWISSGLGIFGTTSYERDENEGVLRSSK